MFSAAGSRPERSGRGLTRRVHALTKSGRVARGAACSALACILFLCSALFALLCSCVLSVSAVVSLSRAEGAAADAANAPLENLGCGMWTGPGGGDAFFRPRRGDCPTTHSVRGEVGYTAGHTYRRRGHMRG